MQRQMPGSFKIDYMHKLVIESRWSGDPKIITTNNTHVRFTTSWQMKRGKLAEVSLRRPTLFAGGGCNHQYRVTANCLILVNSYCWGCEWGLIVELVDYNNCNKGEWTRRGTTKEIFKMIIATESMVLYNSSSG